MAGSLLAGFRSGNFIRPNLILGICIIFLAFVLKALLDYLTSNKINPYTKLSFSRQDNRSVLLITTIFFYDAFPDLIPAPATKDPDRCQSDLYHSDIRALFFCRYLSSEKYSQKKYDIILEALIVSPPLFFLFGMGLQHENPISNDFVMAVPLFFCYIATGIAFRVTDFEKESSLSDTGMIEQMAGRTHPDCIIYRFY